MIKDYLEKSLKANHLYNSWLIQANDHSAALEELKDFIRQNLLKGTIPLETHPDFKLIEKPASGVGSKNIIVEQIRGLQEFLNKTSAISNYKVGVIYQAELMNPNASNCCLKILEDTPNNSYIFLIAEHAANILPTISSRCIKININNENQIVTDDTYLKHISLLLKTNADLRLGFLKELSDKNRELWIEFSQNILQFLGKIIKSASGVEILLDALEEKIASQFKSRSTPYLLKKFDAASLIASNTATYDLDLRASCIILINMFED